MHCLVVTLKDRQTERQRQTDRQTETDRDRHRNTETQRHKDRDRERDCHGKEDGAVILAGSTRDAVARFCTWTKTRGDVVTW